MRQRIPSRQKERHEKMSDVQMFWSLCAECVEFLSQRRSGAVSMESRHGEDQTDKQRLYQTKRSDRVLTRTAIMKQECERNYSCRQHKLHSLPHPFFLPPHAISVECHEQPFSIPPSELVPLLGCIISSEHLHSDALHETAVIL